MESLRADCLGRHQQPDGNLTCTINTAIPCSTPTACIPITVGMELMPCLSSEQHEPPCAGPGAPNCFFESSIRQRQIVLYLLSTTGRGRQKNSLCLLKHSLENKVNASSRFGHFEYLQSRTSPGEQTSPIIDLSLSCALKSVIISKSITLSIFSPKLLLKTFVHEEPKHTGFDALRSGP
jgi:hypothetical protein